MMSSHQQQISFMDKEMKTQFKMAFQESGEWPDFIEMCERRNLLTHTGGVVSPPYISNCSQNGVEIKGLKVGSRIGVNPKYFSNSVAVTYQVGIKICYELWRKFVKDEREKADTALNELCYNLIHRRAYGIAEKLLIRGVDVLSKQGSDLTRRMMIVNLANAMRLQGKQSEANNILDREDWSSTKDSFNICVAAVKGDLDAVEKHMVKMGHSGELTAQNFRDWPVFRKIRNNERFVKVFESVFGEPLIAASALQLADKPVGQNAIIEVAQKAPSEK